MATYKFSTVIFGVKWDYDWEKLIKYFEAEEEEDCEFILNTSEGEILFIEIKDNVEYSQGFICLKHLAHNEPYFKGHFPKNPILPGVLMVEMAAQASLILTTYKQNKFKFNEDSDSKQEGYLVKTNNFTFYNKAKPGDSLRIRVRLTQNTGNYYTANALISFADSNGRVAKGELVFYLPSKEETKNVN